MPLKLRSSARVDRVSSLDGILIDVNHPALSINVGINGKNLMMILKEKKWEVADKYQIFSGHRWLGFHTLPHLFPDVPVKPYSPFAEDSTLWIIVIAVSWSPLRWVLLSCVVLCHPELSWESEPVIYC